MIHQKAPQSWSLVSGYSHPRSDPPGVAEGPQLGFKRKGQGGAGFPGPRAQAVPRAACMPTRPAWECPAGLFTFSGWHSHFPRPCHPSQPP